MAAEGEEGIAPAYGCPRCGALAANWRGAKQHLRNSPRCRSSFEDLDKTKLIQRQCREAARRSELRQPSEAASPLAVPTPTKPMEPVEFELNIEEVDIVVNLPKDKRGAVRACGVGGRILGRDGKVMGRVVAEDKKHWRLDDGRTAKKTLEGKKWRWDEDAEVEGGVTDADTTLPSTKNSSSDPSPAWTPFSSFRAAGFSPLSTSGAASPLLLPEPSLPLPEELSDLDEEEAPETGAPCGKAFVQEVDPSAFATRICDSLALDSALSVMRTCKEWANALNERVPLTLPPPQADAFLQFCLLEVLVVFDDARLPLPVSALYSEMRTAARRALGKSHVRRHLEREIFQRMGPASKGAQERFLKGCPHHIAWTPELKGSGFRTLERLSRHFHTERLIEVNRLRWQKRIHHSPNTRSCAEWLLVKVNRSHPLFEAHAKWRAGAQQSPA